MKIIMGLKICLLITLLTVASAVSSSSAARCGSSIPMPKVDENQESVYSEDDQVSNRDDIHERLLRAFTKDYGRPDPAPTFAKPPNKLIQN